MTYAIELKDISKRFGAVVANNKVCIAVEKGTIHGIVGENGAGKSTLMSILYGFYQADSGTIVVNGQTCRFVHSQQAIAAGIGMVHQHFMLVDNFTVLENVILGAEGGRLLAQGMRQARYELESLADQYGLHVDLDATIDSLSVGLQQRVEILKALYRGAKILILDEPTGVLTPQETDELFKIFLALKQQGVTIVLITHKLREIMAVTDNVSIMRQGSMVAHSATKDTNENKLAEQMVGRKVLFTLEKQSAQLGSELLQVNNISFQDEQGIQRLHDIRFAIKAGEILGVAGVSGNGQSTLLDVLTGIAPMQTGHIYIKQRRFDSQHPLDPACMRDMGMAHVPEDRHRMGMITAFSAAESAILGYHHDPALHQSGWLKGWLKPSLVKQRCQTLMNDFDVRPVDVNLKSANFSGGNQQKLILAREMARSPDILVIGQPTRGVDVGAIEFIHQQIIAMRDAGKGILLVSVELDEILSLSDRIIVLCDGKITGEVASAEANEHTLGMLMANVTETNHSQTNRQASASQSVS